MVYVWKLLANGSITSSIQVVKIVDIFCKDCKDFMVSFEMFLKNTDEIDNQYLKYFVSDFLNISNQTLENYFPEAV